MQMFFRVLKCKLNDLSTKETMHVYGGCPAMSLQTSCAGYTRVLKRLQLGHVCLTCLFFIMSTCFFVHIMNDHKTELYLIIRGFCRIFNLLRNIKLSMHNICCITVWLPCLCILFASECFFLISFANKAG